MNESLYILGILVAFADPALYSLSNIIDNYYVNHSFRHIVSVVIFGTAISVLFLPVIWLIDAPGMLPIELIPVTIVLAAIAFLYQFPYFQAMQNSDTSIIAALFSLGRIFVPVLAFFFVGEQLHLWQYGGFTIVTIASIILAKTPGKHFRLNRSFFLMFIVVFLLAVESVLYKYIFQEVSWGTGVLWVWLFEIIFVLLAFLHPKTLQYLREDFPAIRKKWNVFLGQGVIDLTAGFGYTYAIYLIPVSIVKGIGSTQSLFVLLFSWILSRTRAGKILKEDLEKTALRKKIILYGIIILGTAIIIWS